MMRTRFVMPFFKAISALVLSLLPVPWGAAATDWPQFRGPHRNGIWDETGILESFPREGLKICWRHPVGGGFSSPVVAEGRVFVLDAELTKPTSRERVHCFEEKTGKVLWVYVHEEHYSEWTFVPERGAGPTATPILSNTSTAVPQGEYIYSCRSPGELVCLEAVSGRQLWSTNSVTKPKNGASSHITPQGGGFFLFTDEGNLIRAQLSPAGYRELGRSHLIDPTWPFAGTKYVYAPPAFANRYVFARSEAEVVCASLENGE